MQHRKPKTHKASGRAGHTLGYMMFGDNAFYGYTSPIDTVDGFALYMLNDGNVEILPRKLIKNRKGIFIGEKISQEEYLQRSTHQSSPGPLVGSESYDELSMFAFNIIMCRAQGLPIPTFSKVTPSVSLPTYTNNQNSSKSATTTDSKKCIDLSQDPDPPTNLTAPGRSQSSSSASSSSVAESKFVTLESFDLTGIDLSALPYIPDDHDPLLRQSLTQTSLSSPQSSGASSEPAPDLKAICFFREIYCINKQDTAPFMVKINGFDTILYYTKINTGYKKGKRIKCFYDEDEPIPRETPIFSLMNPAKNDITINTLPTKLYIKTQNIETYQIKAVRIYKNSLRQRKKERQKCDTSMPPTSFPPFAAASQSSTQVLPSPTLSPASSIILPQTFSSDALTYSSSAPTDQLPATPLSILPDTPIPLPFTPSVATPQSSTPKSPLSTAGSSVTPSQNFSLEKFSDSSSTPTSQFPATPVLALPNTPATLPPLSPSVATPKSSTPSSPFSASSPGFHGTPSPSNTDLDIKASQPISFSLGTYVVNIQDTENFRTEIDGMDINLYYTNINTGYMIQKKTTSFFYLHYRLPSNTPIFSEMDPAKHKITIETLPTVIYIKILNPQTRKTQAIRISTYSLNTQEKQKERNAKEKALKLQSSNTSTSPASHSSLNPSPHGTLSQPVTPDLDFKTPTIPSSLEVDINTLINKEDTKNFMANINGANIYLYYTKLKIGDDKKIGERKKRKYFYYINQNIFPGTPIFSKINPETLPEGRLTERNLSTYTLYVKIGETEALQIHSTRFIDRENAKAKRKEKFVKNKKIRTEQNTPPALDTFLKSKPPAKKTSYTPSLFKPSTPATPVVYDTAPMSPVTPLSSTSCLIPKTPTPITPKVSTPVIHDTAPPMSPATPLPSTFPLSITPETPATMFLSTAPSTPMSFPGTPSGSEPDFSVFDNPMTSLRGKNS